MSFHPDSNLPGCMMPDGGDCCAGHAAVCEDWHKQRQRIAELESNEKAYEAILGQRTYNEVAAHIEGLEAALGDCYRELKFCSAQLASAGWQSSGGGSVSRALAAAVAALPRSGDPAVSR